jgi:hypothetical protein
MELNLASNFCHTNTTCMLQFTNKQPIKLKYNKSYKFTKWINFTLQNHTKWKIRKLPRLCCIVCLNILHIRTCCNLQVTTPLELWKQVIEEPWTCTWTMLLRIDECALLIKVTNLQNHYRKILVIRSYDALYMTYYAWSFQQSTKCT